MLELLSLRKGTTLSKEMFLNHLYGGMDEPELKIIDVFICKLRKKLSMACDGDNYIETVWGRGYVPREPDEEKLPQAAVAASPIPRAGGGWLGGRRGRFFFGASRSAGLVSASVLRCSLLREPLPCVDVMPACDPGPLSV